MTIKEYFVSIFKGLHSLLKGMQVTGKELVTRKVTEQYPENRATLNIPERFRGTLEFIYDEEGRHKCIACRTCERNCPNGTISITTRMVDLPNGKKKQKLDTYTYDLGSCTFCNLCVLTCPTQAIEFSNDFEQAVFRREALVKKLNYLPEKDDEPAATPAAAAKPAAPAAAAKPAAPAAAKPAAPAAEAKPAATEAKPAPEKVEVKPAAAPKAEPIPAAKPEEKPAEKAAEMPRPKEEPKPVEPKEEPKPQVKPEDNKPAEDKDKPEPEA